MIKEIDPKEPIEFAWNAFVDEMVDRKWGATDAFKWAWKEARKQEREACAKIADKSHRIFRDTKDAHDRNSPNLEPFNPNAFGFSNYAIEESLKITLAIRARGQE